MLVRREDDLLVRRELAEALLTYWPVLDDFPDSARIEGCGTRRRLQALLHLTIATAQTATDCLRSSNPSAGSR